MIKGTIAGYNGYDIPYKADIKGEENVVVIVIHGFASSKESPTVNMLMEAFPKMGLGIIAFDFPGHGESPVDGDDLSVKNCIDDLRAIEDYGRKLAPHAEIGYFGSSFGAYIALNYMMERRLKVARIFMRSGAVNMSEYFMEMTDEERREIQEHGYFVIDDMARDLKVTGALIEELRRYDLFKSFNKGNNRLMMIHGSMDEDIAYDRAKAFAKEHDIELVTVDGGDHRLSIPGAPEKVLEEALDFFR